MIEEEEEDSSNIKDKYFATYFLFYAIGVLTLVPANFFTTATDVSFLDKKPSSIYNFEVLVLDVQISRSYK